MDRFSRPPRPPHHHPATSKSCFLANKTEIAAARDDLEAWLRAKIPHMTEIRVFEIVLAADELFCNAFDHGDAAAGCMFDMRRASNRLMLTVRNAADGAHVRQADFWRMPAAGEHRGRGLAIVKKLANDVDVHATPSSVSITAIFDVSNRTPPEPALAATLAL